MPSFSKKDQEATGQNSSNRDSAAFINNAQVNDAKTKSNLIQIPSITLPKGGGAIKSIDEKFSVNAANGTSSYSIPLPLSPGRSNFTPSLSLGYNSGGGNSPFGLGWGAEPPAIQRKLEKKLPEYKDEFESDTFVFSGSEDLVPELIKDNNGKWTRKTYNENSARIECYRPRIEGIFARIERVTDGENLYWRVRTKENVVSVFGKTDGAKLKSPIKGEEFKIFKWCLEYSYDDKGNFTAYSYKKEDLEKVPLTVFEKNRTNGIAPFTNIYLKNIRYGNKSAFYEGDVIPNDFLFELVFDYGEHDLANATTVEINKWKCRKDPYSDFRSGFEIRTYRLCQRVLMFHHFKDELGWDDYLVRSMEFGYDERPHLTYLENITQTGFIWNTDGSLKSQKSLPPLEFSYFKPGFSREIKEISSANILNSPVGLDSQQYQWVDLYNEGIAGILTEQATGWFYKENLGKAEFTPAKLVNPKPSFQGLSGGTLFRIHLYLQGE